MAKLIPGKVRIEGVALYETGKVDIIKEKNNRLYARVAEEELRYSLEDDLVFCACDFFQKRGYCVHLAALEHFLKNDERGQEILQSLEEGHEEKGRWNQGNLWVANFWTESCLQKQNVPMNYRLWGKWKQEPIISCGPLESGKSIAKNTMSFGTFHSF